MGSTLGSIVGGIAGQQASSGAAGNANNDAQIQNQILQEIGKAPDIGSKQIILQKYQQAGILTPEMEQNINAAMPQAITTDPALAKAQMESLSQFQNAANQGLTATDRAALAQAQQAAGANTQGQLGAIQQQMQQRGLSDSGSNLAAELSAAQNGSNQMANSANQIAAQSQQARMAAAAQAGSMATGIQGQQFQQGLQQQAAQQAMERFNTQNQLQVQNQNTQAANQAQVANLSNQQNLQNMNTQGANAEQYNQLQRQMQQYGANTGVAQLQAGGYGNLSNYNNNLANQQAQSAYNTYSGAGQALSGGINAQQANQAAGGNGGFLSYLAYDGGQPWHQGGSSVDYRQGGQVQGHEVVPGDHPVNDNVHAKLSAKEIVVPKTLAQTPLGNKLLDLIHAHNAVKDHLNSEG